MAEAKGHKVLLTPPYHSDFQPIELVWAKVKGNVGRMYDQNSNMKIVLARLKKEFTDLEEHGSASIQGMIDKCINVCEEFYTQALRNDDHDESDDSDYNISDDSIDSSESDEDLSSDGSIDSANDEDH